MSNRALAVAEFRAGWKQLLFALIGIMLGCHALFQWSQGLFMKPLQSDFGWTRSEVSAAISIFNFVIIFMTPLYGILVDRIGVRPIATFSSMFLAAGFYSLSLSTGDIYRFYGMVFLTALLGGGTVTMVYMRLIGGWFDKARGFAIGIAATGTGIAALSFPPIISVYIGDHGWRSGYVFLSILAAIGAPLAFFLVRENPRLRDSSGVKVATGYTLGQAVATRRFWILGVTFCVAGGAVGGMSVHFVPMLLDHGITLANAGAIAGLIGVAIVISRLVTGYLCDHIFAPYIAAVVFALVAIGIGAFLIAGPQAAVVTALMIGIGMGVEVDLVGYMSARYFGLRQYGSIIGLQFAFFSTGAAMAPIGMGLMYDLYGGYSVPLTIIMALLMLSVPAMFFIGRYPTAEELAARG